MNPEELLTVAKDVVSSAVGGEEMEVACSRRQSTSVKVYEGEVEAFTSAEDFGLGIRLVKDGKQGFAAAGSLDPEVVQAVLAEARDNWRFSEADTHLKVAQPDGVAATDIDLWGDEVMSLGSKQRVDLAVELERRVRDADERITGIRVANYGDSAGVFALASTSGIASATRSTSAGLSVQALAADGDRTQSGYAYDGARSPSALDVGSVVDLAVERTTGLLGSTKPESAPVDLVLDPRLASTVIGLIASTLTGDRVIKGRSPFIDRLGEMVAPTNVTLVEDPTDPNSLGASAYDGEGLACRPVSLVSEGALMGYLYDSYTGARAGAASTGSAMRGARGLPSPRVQALHLLPDEGTLEELIGSVSHGLYVYTLAGLHSGVNSVSGDFSVGAEGRMIRNGVLAEPVSECTIGSTIQRLLLGVKAVGAEVTHLPSGVSTPPMVLGDVMLSGAAS